MRTTPRMVIGIFLVSAALISIPLAAACDESSNTSTQAGKAQQTAKGMRGPEGMKGVAGVAGSRPSAPDTDPAVSMVTTFVDGPTGYVFVYTVEGWKFVGSGTH
ncbi:MAG: hypothetical protein WCD07_12285 [Burkholderiales bacterium]